MITEVNFMQLDEVADFIGESEGKATEYFSHGKIFAFKKKGLPDIEGVLLTYISEFSLEGEERLYFKLFTPNGDIGALLLKRLYKYAKEKGFKRVYTMESKEKKQLYKMSYDSICMFKEV